MLYTNLVILSFFFFFASSMSSPDDYHALISFKANTDLSNSLSSWVNSTELCNHHSSWLGVTCNPTTHRVTKLVLENLNLTGSIHSLSRLTELRFLSLKNNRLSSSDSFPLNFSSWKNLKHLYLSHNRFSEPFPAGIVHLRRLQRLDLSRNDFYGNVPMTELTQLPRLLTIQLQFNSFIGTLKSPSSASIRVFNVSNNKLSGEIPSWMSRFPSSCFDGNTNLYIQPLAASLIDARPLETASPSRSKDKAAITLITVTVIVILLISLCVIATCSVYLKKRRLSGPHETKADVAQKNYLHRGGGGDSGVTAEEEKGLVVFEGWNLGFNKVSELLKCSAELLGKGSVGTTYKVKFDTGGGCGGEVVVKRVRDRKIRQRRKKVDGWLEVIGGLRDANVVSLRAYYNSADELLLVYDYLHNGSLHSLLHGNRGGPWRTPLDFPTRLNLATGTAKALSFIHGHKNPKLFHGHLTSSNILIDQTGNACVSDIYLHRLLHVPPPSNNAYKSPKLNTNNNSQIEIMQKDDVYSLGVILLEILTGKIAAGEEEVVRSVKWIQSVGREALTVEVFDIELLSNKEMEEHMVALLQVALLCVASLTKDHPKASTVYKMMEDIGTNGVIQSGESFVLMHGVSFDSYDS